MRGHRIAQCAGVALAAGAMAAYAAPARAATRSLTITGFDAMRVEAPVNVIVTTGSGVSARADGDRTVLDRLRITISGRTLVVRMERPQVGQKNAAGTATLHLSTDRISRVVLSGGGSISIDRMRGLRGDIALNGNGDVNVGTVDLDQLNLTMAGGGRAVLTGQAGTATIRVSGPGTVAAEALRARQAALFNDGPGALIVSADVAATVRASGSGDVTVMGRAACTVTNQGTGRVSCAGTEY
ncbi:MAG: DUF2807 domain-containing protein [Sphingobium sp.]